MSDNIFAKIIAKVYSIARPHLTIVDGITVMEGDGPSGGKARPLGLVMASADAVAVDACAAADSRSIDRNSPTDVDLFRVGRSAGKCWSLSVSSKSMTSRHRQPARASREVRNSSVWCTRWVRSSRPVRV